MKYTTDSEFDFVKTAMRTEVKGYGSKDRFSYGYSECNDMNAGARDEFGDDCEAYVATARCGKYDTDDFKAQATCCSCGGGCFDKPGTATDIFGNGCEYYS